MDGKKAALFGGLGCILVGGLGLVVLLGGVGLYYYLSSRGAAVATSEPGRGPEGAAATAESPGERGNIPGYTPPEPSEAAAVTAPVYNSREIKGLFYMQKLEIVTRSLQKAVWYFAPDGAVYVNPETLEGGASLPPRDRGQATVGGGKMVVAWASGQRWEGELKIVDDSFEWQDGIYIPAKPFAAAAEMVGSYEGGISVSGNGGSTTVVRTLDVAANGTYQAEGLISTTSDGSRVGSRTGKTTGTWKLEGWTLTLTGSDGKVVRGITVPLDDEKTPVKPDRLYFGSISYKKK